MIDANAYVKEQPAIRLLMIRQALGFEIKGMRLTGKAPTGLTICRKEFGLKAKNAEAMLPKFQKLLDDNGIVFAGDKPKEATTA